MSASSRRHRQMRGALARYLSPALIEAMLGVTAAEVDAWATGDARVADNNSTEVAYFCLQYAVRTFGFDDAHEWFTTTNAGLGGATPADTIASRLAIQALGAARADSAFGDIPLTALDRNGTPRVALAGDWHGNLGHAIGALERLAKMNIRTVLHLGDWGLWPGPHGAKYVRRVHKACEQNDITIHITDGNHEDHDRLALIEPVEGTRWITDRIGFFERGHRWKWAGTTFVSLGGAPSLDRADLVEGRSWWPGEQISHRDVARAVAGGPVDVMLTHDAPEPATRAVAGILLHNPQGWPREALDYAEEGRARLSYAFHALQPRLLVHGHFHVVDRATVTVPGATRDSEVISLGCDGMGGNLAILDIETLGVTVL